LVREFGGGVVSEDVPIGAVVMPAGVAAGSRVAGYLLVEQVGAGGMAVVFRARDEQLQREVALKVLAPGLGADPGFRRRFAHESLAAAAIDDPHIIPVYAAGESDGVLFIAMRYVPGGDARTLVLRDGPLPLERAAAIISPVASALDAAHAAGLVHRDVKPANMLVDVRANRPDHVYLSDFGLSKGALASIGLTGTGQVMGTPSYMAPEQIEGTAVDGRTDQYALACAAFELLTGEPPFPRDQGIAVLHAHLSQQPPPLASRRPGLPAAADEVLARALAKAPANRFGSCHEFADALRESLGLAPYHSGGTAPQAAAGPLPAEAGRPAGSGPHTATISPATAPAFPAGRSPATHPSPGQGPTPRRRRMTAGWIAGAAAALVAVLVGAYVVLAPHGPASGTPQSLSQSSGPGTGSRGTVSGSQGPVSGSAGTVSGSAGSSGPATQSSGPGPGSQGSSGPAARVISGASYAFSAPNRVAADGKHVWVTNPPGNSVTELNASDGSWVATLTGAGYGLNGPVGIADDGTHVWVTCGAGNSVTELNAGDGSVARVLTGTSYSFDAPVGIVSDGTHVWVANSDSNTVTELNAGDGALLRIVSGASFNFVHPYAVADDGQHVWVANGNGNSVTELNNSDGSLVQNVSGATYGFNYPSGIASDGTHVWVVNSGGNSVTELNASDGSLAQLLNAASYGFASPRSVALDAADVWVTDVTGNSVTELNAGDGSLVRIVNAASDGLNGPWGEAVSGGAVWIANSGGNSVTELPTG
jgi:hypothetical protein